MNFFKRKLTSDEIEELYPKLKASEDFYYSITEGGFISNDCHVIFYVERIPYIGMLMPFHREGDVEQGRWVAYFKEKFNLVNI